MPPILLVIDFKLFEADTRGSVSLLIIALSLEPSWYPIALRPKLSETSRKEESKRNELQLPRQHHLIFFFGFFIIIIRLDLHCKSRKDTNISHPTPKQIYEDVKLFLKRDFSYFSYFATLSISIVVASTHFRGIYCNTLFYYAKKKKINDSCRSCISQRR